jgi:hypothetical protein
MSDTKIVLPESELPRRWYNIAADMPRPAQPPLHPGTGQPIGPDDLAPLFPMGLILQEVSGERFVDIHEFEVLLTREVEPVELEDPAQLGDGSRMVVDAQIHGAIAASEIATARSHNQKRCRLPPATVTSGVVSGL